MAYITAQEVKNVREQLKKAFPEFKFAVSGGSSSTLKVAIMKGPIDFSDIQDTRWEKTDINQYWLGNYGKFAELFEKMYTVMKSQNWYDKSDAMIDYFDIAYYTYLSIGKSDKPYVQVK